jgi:hypothetical protein
MDWQLECVTVYSVPSVLISFEFKSVRLFNCMCYTIRVSSTDSSLMLAIGSHPASASEGSDMTRHHVHS